MKELFTLNPFWANVPDSKAVKINNCSDYDQSIKMGTGLLNIVKMKFKRGAKSFEGEMMSFWQKLRNVWARHRPKISHQVYGFVILSHQNKCSFER